MLTPDALNRAAGFGGHDDPGQTGETLRNAPVPRALCAWALGVSLVALGLHFLWIAATWLP